MSELEKPSPIRRVYDVPETSGPELRVIRLKGKDVCQCTVISSALWGVEIHYDHVIRRSEPCLEDESKCPGCQVKKPKKRLYYLHIFSHLHGQCFLELTEEAARRLKALMEGEKTYRGHALEFRRTAADNGRILVRFSDSMAPRQNLPKEKDPEPTLMYLWQWGRK